VAQKFTDRPKVAPQGAFSAREPRAEPVLPRKPAAESKAPSVQHAAEPRSAVAAPVTEPTLRYEAASEPPAITQPITQRAAPLEQSFEELLIDDIEANPVARAPSSLPPPLGQSEGHDAWTVDRLSRQSTVPPVRRDDVDRLRELSALPLGEQSLEIRGGALDLVNRSRPSQQLDIIGEMEELYALDDLSGALRQAEFVLGRYPDHEQAMRCAINCRSRLIQLYSSKIGPMNRVVTQALEDSQLRWLGLDHRSGFLLSRVDGVSTVEEILDICGMPRLEALKTLADLLDRGAISLD
jgi:hypothetical protein